MRSGGRPLVLGLLLTAAAPAPQVDPGMAETLRNLAAADLRVASIAYRLQTSAVDYCRRRGRLSGLVVQDGSQYAARLRSTLAALFGIEDLPTVVSVVPGSAGARAGLQPGDGIVSVNGRSLTEGLSASREQRADGNRITVITDRMTAAFDAGPVELTLRRAGAPLTIRMEGAPACPSKVQLDLDGGRNAGADGQTVTIQAGFYTFARSDDELAVEIGHELSHNILGHRDIIKDEKISEGLLSGLGRNGARLRDTERQADYLGLYLMVWAGYDIHAGPEFWRRMDKSDPLGGLFPSGTHPGRGARARFLEREVREIEAQSRSGRTPTPDYAAFMAGEH